MAIPENPEQHEVVRRLRERDGEALAEVTQFRGELTLVLHRSAVRRVAEWLCDEAGMQFSFLTDVTGVDRFPVEPRFELNYHLLSLERKERVRLKVRLGSDEPVVESVTQVWPTANWHEREIFDLLGVRFEGHPDLRRLLMPLDWEGHPLRKDYPVEGYR